MSLPTINHFQSLGVTPTTSFADIKRAYRKLSLKYHPDKTPDVAHHEKFKEINAAFEAIRDHYEKFNATSSPQMPTSSTPNSSAYTAYQQFSTSTAGQNFSSRQYYSRFSHSEHTASNVRNGARAHDNSAEGAYFQAFHKSQEQRRKASQEAADMANRNREKLVEMLKAEAEAKRREELRRAEARKREVEKLEEELKRAEIERKKMEAAKQRQEEEQRKQRQAQTVDTEAKAEQNQKTKSRLENLGGDSEEKYNTYDHKSLHANGVNQNREYQNAKQRRRDMVDAAETADEVMRKLFDPDDTEKFYKSKKSRNVKTNDEKENYVPTSKRRKNDVSYRGNGTNSGKGINNPIVLEDDTSDIEAISISDEPYILEDDEITIVEEISRDRKVNNKSSKSFNMGVSGTKNGSRVSIGETSDSECNSEKLDEYIPFTVRPKVPPRSSTTFPPRPDIKAGPSSPGRPTPPPTTHIRHHATSPHKRSKISTTNSTSAFDMGNLEINVGDIDEVDFRELGESLPDHLKRKQPTSNSSNVANNTRSTRGKPVHFTDGTSRAETLSTPLNKNSVRGHSAARFNTSDERSTRAQLSVLDFHASPKVHNFIPPQPPILDLDPDISRNKWHRYVKSMVNYQRSFLEYKELIVRYQVERTQKDFEHFDTVNDLQDQKNLNVYNACLKRDFEVITQYQEALRVFSLNMILFQQNCQWISRVKQHDPNWI